MSARVSELRRIMSTRPAAITVEEGARKARPWDRASSGRVAFAHFALSGMALLIVVGTIGVVALRHVAREEALRDARALTAALARGVIQPQVSDAVLAGDPDALRRLDRLVHERVLGPPNPSQPKDSSIVRIKVWDTDGRIVYSDEPRLRGRRFVLPEDLREAMDARKASADVSDLSRPENRFERGKGSLVEVYQPMRVAGGTLVLLEAYHPAKDIKGASVRIEKSFLWVLLAFLAALALAQLPLAWFLARRIRADEQERERLRRAGDDALEGERRRIAAELHDGVVQDLAGVAYELQAAADRLPTNNGHDPDLGAALRRGAGVCRGSMRALRALLVDLYPSERREQGLDAAVEALARPLRERGVDVAVDMDLERTLPSTTTELVYRAVQEALRNVDRHAAARTASVALRDDGEAVTLVVEDDGRGMTGDNLREQHAAGHMGLALLADGVAARGGSLSIESEPGTGTRVHVTLPRD
ncbi:MAG: two-component system, NarL family, sensor kinase [Solirubrobacteraceae bacterium]|jgi:signal transduction histidine kinase|nr:two-component system, NarL family, sensor kinase [Solirubrobacteraceae bacterium]